MHTAKNKSLEGTELGIDGSTHGQGMTLRREENERARVKGNLNIQDKADTEQRELRRRSGTLPSMWAQNHSGRNKRALVSATNHRFESR